MRYRRSRRAPRNAARIAGRTSELAIASAQTIGHRSALMMQSLDEPELTRMWAEKMQVAAEVASAAATRLPAMQMMWWSTMWLHTAQAAAALYRSSANVNTLPLRCAQAGFSAWMGMNNYLMSVSLRETDETLRAVGRVASSNAKRLAKARGRQGAANRLT